ncbi:MAG: retroviral-like aspartic protease family protein [Bacteroidota bacterium]
MPEVQCGFSDGPQSKGFELLIQFGPTIYVNIGFDGKWKPGVPVAPIPGVTKIEALVDTGATRSCIDDALAQSLNLPVVDMQPLGGVSGTLMSKVYLAQVHVPSLQRTIYGTFNGVHLVAGGQTHRALLGRTFLRGHIMTYNGNTGEVKISS